MKNSVAFPLDKISKPLLKWFRARARSLPWRTAAVAATAWSALLAVIVTVLVWNV